MDFKQLRSFVAVADCGSFTKAAAQLYSSQPTLSTHIRQLEQELHAQLFLRTTKTLSITPRGQELYDYAVEVLRLQQRLLSGWAQEANLLRLAASTIPASCILPELLPELRARLPEVALELYQSDSAGVLQALRTGRCEIGLVGMAEAAEDMRFAPFFRDRMVLIAPNTPEFSALQRRGASCDELLKRHPLLVREAGSGSAKHADDIFQALDLPRGQLRICAHLSDQQSIKNLVAAGLGLSLISEKAVQEECACGRLLRFPLPEGVAERQLLLVRRKSGALRPNAQRFWELVLSHYLPEA